MSGRGRAWSFLAGAIVAEVTGSLALKAALDQPWLYALVAVGYLISFACLSRVLQEGLPLGIAYGIWGAAGVAFTAVLSTVLFGDPFTALLGVGIILVIAGVLCVEMGARPAREESLG